MIQLTQFTTQMTQFSHFALEHWPLCAGFVVVLGLIIWTEIQAKISQVQALSPQSVVEWINHKQARVIDIRSAEMFSKGHIVGSENMQAAHLLSALTEGKNAKKYQNIPIIIACDQGILAQKAAAPLKDKLTIAVMKGGLRAWTACDLPLITSK